MLADALGAPTRSADALGTLLVGGVLLLLSVLFPLVWLVAVLRSPLLVALAPLAVFPPLVLLGYELRALDAGARGETATPSFVDVAGLVRAGVASLVVRGAYLLPLAVVGAAAGGVVLAVRTGSVGPPPGAGDAVVLGVSLLAGLFGVVYAGVYLYVRPAALTVLAVTGRTRAALSPRRVLAVALSGDYLVGWGLSGVVLAVGLLVALPLGLLLVGFFLAFYVRAAAHYLAGRAVAPACSELGLLDGGGGSGTEPPVGRDADPAVQAGRGVDPAGPPSTAFEWRFDGDRDGGGGPGAGTGDRTAGDGTAGEGTDGG